MPHDLDEAITIFIKTRHHFVLQLVVQRRGMAGVHTPARLHARLHPFWDTYIEASGDKGVTGAAAPFFAFRGLVVASPVWYPNLTIDVRRSLFRFIENVLDVPRFEPDRVNEYCGI